MYARIAAELRAQIASGELAVGAQLPTHKQLAEQHGISTGTVHRVTALLSKEGLVEVGRGRRATVIQQPPPDADQSQGTVGGVAAQRDSTLTETAAAGGAAAMAVPQLWVITLRGPDGRRYPVRHVCEDIARPDSFRAHLLAIARIERPTDADHGEGWIGDYELELANPGKSTRTRSSRCAGRRTDPPTVTVEPGALAAVAAAWRLPAEGPVPPRRHCACVILRGLGRIAAGQPKLCLVVLGDPGWFLTGGTWLGAKSRLGSRGPAWERVLMERRRGDEQMVIVATAGSSELDPPTIYVEVSTPPAAAPGGSDWAGDDVRENRAQKLVESAHDLVGDGVALARACAVRFSAGLRELPENVPAPDEVELQLGITLDAELGAVLAKAKASAQLQLTLTWKNGVTRNA